MAENKAAIAANYSLDADPQGIRAYAADAIMGALAFGAQGNNPPPEGHWLAPFWEAARADAALQMTTALADGWISVDERLPMEADPNVVFEQENFIVTDGQRVTTCWFDRGSAVNPPWASWSLYGDMLPERITHWRRLPPPPSNNASKDSTND